MFDKRYLAVTLPTLLTVSALLAAPSTAQESEESDVGCGPYISGGPDNPTTGELVATAVVDGILLGLYVMDGGDHFIWVRCDTYHQIGDPIPIEN